MAKGFSVWVDIGARLLPSLTQVPNKVQSEFATMARGIKVKAAEAKIALKEMSAAMSPLASMAVAGGLSIGFEKAIESSSHLAHELQNLRNAGRTPLEVAKAMAEANRTIAALPTTTLLDNLKVLNETTGAFGNFQHALDNLTFNQRIGSMMQNMLGDAAGSPGEMFNNIVRAMEMRGTAQVAGAYQREVSQLYRAMVFTGGRVNPAEFFGYAQQANPYIKGMSERYMTKIAPSLIQEFGGDRAGTMQNTWTGTILGKAKNKISTEAWMALGLLDPKGVISNKVGPVGWKPGAIKNTDLALSDPLKWSETVLIPALKAHGFQTNDQLSLAKALMPLFRDRNAQRLASVLVSDKDRARLHKDEGLINKVPGADAAYQQTLRRDPLQAWKAVTASFSNLASVIFGAGNKESPVAVALVDIAKGIDWLTRVFERHQIVANLAGMTLGFAAGVATLKAFGIALRWIFSPLKLLLAPFRMLGGLLWRTLGPVMFRAILASGTFIRAGIMRLAPIFAEGFAAIAPAVGEAIMGVFALVSNPVGWTVLAVLALAAAIALVITFKKQIVAWFKKTWPAVKSAFLSLDWASIGTAIGWAIADALTLGLASKMPAIASGLHDFWQNHAPTWAGGGASPAPKPAPAGAQSKNFRFDKQARGQTPALLAAPKVAGHRALGGPVLGGRTYLVGERGPELFHAPFNGSIVTADRTAALLREAAAHGRTARRHVTPAVPRDRRGHNAPSVVIRGATIIIKDARDPHATAREVKRALQVMATNQSAFYSD